ncbi:MAG TPA: glycosyltransferase, partial [bacterium]|nr:glycosyltransferase [bacterium]
MKVGLVICGDLGFPSGGFLYDRKLVDTLRRAGDEVDVISLPWDGYAARLARGLDPRLHARLRSFRGDVLLQDELAHPSLAFVNATLRRARSIPIVSIVHHLRVSERLGAVSAAAARAAERAYLRSVDAFVFNGQATRETVEALIGAKAPGIIAPPGGDRLERTVTEEHAAARAREPGPLRILFVGNLIPRKGLLVLLRALASLPQGECSLTVAGSEKADPSHARALHQFVDAHG